MPIKMLYEFVASLTILIVNEEDHVRSFLGEEYIARCKKLIYASTAEEALAIYKRESIDLVVINIDRCGRDALPLITEILKKDIYQRILVSAQRFNDTEIVLKLSNMGVSGFICKSHEISEAFPLLLRVFTQIYDRLLLVRYVKDLEEQIVEALYVPCRADCPRSPILHKHVTPSADVLEDDFEFFPTPPQNVPEIAVDKSIYKDYFRFLQSDDKEELHDQLNDIDTFLFDAFGESKMANADSIALLGNVFSRFGNILMHYQFFSDTGMCIIELGQTIAERCEILTEKSSDFEPLLSGFCSVLQTFIAQVWEREAEDPKFFNDSIINDARMIVSIIIPAVTSANSTNDDDLIFF